MQAVTEQFEIAGRFIDAVRYGSGHIHDTYLARFGDAPGVVRYVLQKLNRSVFPDPVAVMDNLARICAHQRRALEAEGLPDRDRRCPQVIRTRQGRSYWVDPAGDFWRCFAFQERTRSIDQIESEAQAYQIARAFGAFAARLADLDAAALAVTIPRFHDLAHRYTALEAAVGDDACAEAKRATSEIERSAHWFERLSAELQRSGAADLPTRVVHNDCKINNVLLDADTGEGLCVIDLDTVMGGTVIADFGELLRSACAYEDVATPEAISIEPGCLRGVARGYLAGAGGMLSGLEVGLLALAGTRMALENAIRFLTDHLRGDVYFRTRRRGQNLDRCRSQLRLVELLWARRSELDTLLTAAAAEVSSR